MLGLMAFTLALTISFAQDRFESRRHATLDEANTIGTARLRTGLAGPSGKSIGALIEEYALGRLSYLVALSPNAAAEALARTTNTLQTKIWQRALMLDHRCWPRLSYPLNDMFDASLVQRYANGEPCADRDDANAADRRHARGQRARLSDGSRRPPASGIGASESLGHLRLRRRKLWPNESSILGQRRYQGASIASRRPLLPCEPGTRSFGTLSERARDRRDRTDKRPRQ